MQLKNTHLIFGVVSGLASILIGLVLYLTGAAFTGSLRYYTFVPLFVACFWNAFSFSRANNGFVTYGNVFYSSFKVSVISTAFLLAYTILSMFIFPEMKDKAMELARQEMAKNPNMTDEVMENALNISRKAYPFFVIFGSLVMGLVQGAVYSLIAAILPEKKGENLFGMDVTD